MKKAYLKSLLVLLAMPILFVASYSPVICFFLTRPISAHWSDDIEKIQAIYQPALRVVWEVPFGREVFQWYAGLWGKIYGLPNRPIGEDIAESRRLKEEAGEQRIKE